MGMWQELSSSMIQRAKYDEPSQVMEIQFVGGEIYAYDDVPPDEFTNLVNAASSGSYFHNNIKGSYSDRRVG